MTHTIAMPPASLLAIEARIARNIEAAKLARSPAPTQGAAFYSSILPTPISRSMRANYRREARLLNGARP